MVRANLVGAKTMTRRLAWRRVSTGCDDDRPAYAPSLWQKVKPGDLLWVRESVACRPDADDYDALYYPADDAVVRSWADDDETADRFHALYCYRGKRGEMVRSIHMPRWASRLTLIVTATKIEPVQAISEADAMAEGATPVLVPPDGGGAPHVEGFAELWSNLHGSASWNANPEVVAISYRVIKANIDSPEARAA